MTVSQNTIRSAGLPLKAGRWALDLAHSSVGFSIRHLGIARVRGRFTQFDADIVIGGTADTSSLSAHVDLASVHTDNNDRDAHIRSSEILDVASRPTMTFTSTAISGEDDRWVIDGILAIGGDARSFRLDVELGGLADFPLGGPRHAGVTATGQLRRSDFGIASIFPPPVLGAIVDIELDLELLEPES
jgi:polyisoprenoid-binding protein YceI